LPGEKSLTNLKLRPTQPFKKKESDGALRRCLGGAFTTTSSLSPRQSPYMLSYCLQYFIMILSFYTNYTRSLTFERNMQIWGTDSLCQAPTTIAPTKKIHVKTARKASTWNGCRLKGFSHVTSKYFINLKRCWSLTQLN
jgi:hypothetical protein